MTGAWSPPPADTVTGEPVTGAVPAELLVIRLNLWWALIAVVALIAMRWVGRRRGAATAP